MFRKGAFTSVVSGTKGLSIGNSNPSVTNGVHTKSKWLHIDKGSAQGSILGPFCYNVLANDMLSIVSDNIEIYNYADDNTVICSGYEYEDIKAELMLNVD